MKMRKIVFLILMLMTAVVSCRRSGRYFVFRHYYSGEDVYMEGYNDYDKQLYTCRKYYRNGTLMETAYSRMDTNRVAPFIGIVRTYYPDGFSKDCMPLDDDGYSILPNMEDAKVGYKVNFSFAKDSFI